jgi:hypothetical protein
MQRKPKHESQKEESRRVVPDVTMRETIDDLAWIEEHLLLFRAVVLDHYLLCGTGAVVADITPQTRPEFCNPMWYLPAEELESLDEPEVEALLRAYDPTREVVVVLLKHDNQQRSYRVLLPPEFPGVH